MLAKGAVLGHASPSDVARAGAQVLQTCVIERGMGGVAMRIGESKERTGIATCFDDGAFLGRWR